MSKTNTLGHQKTKSESSMESILYGIVEQKRLRQQPDLRTQVTEERKNERRSS